MAITKAELNKKKILAEAVLKIQKRDLDDSLAEYYDRIVQDNNDTLLKALELMAKQQGGNSNGREG